MHCRETPFDSVDGALEYVGHLLQASLEAHQEVEAEIARTTVAGQQRRSEAFQIVSYKLDRLTSHVAKCQTLLKDLRRLRRVILEEHKSMAKSATA
jgi:hypothetical protein